MSQAPTTQHAKPVGEILVEQKLISREQIAEALKAQKQSAHRKLLGEVIIELGFCTEAQVVEALADAYRIPFARITPNLVDPRIIKTLPREFIENNHILPLFNVDNVLTVAVTEPSNVFLVEEIAQMAGCPVQIVAAMKPDIESTLQRYQPEAEGFALEDILKDPGDTGQSADLGTVIDTAGAETLGEESPVVQLVNHLIFSAVREGASDVHIEPGDKSLRVRYRIDGVLSEKLHPPYQMQPAIVSRIKIMASLDISERRLPQDGAISMTVEGNRVDLRVSTLPNKFGEKVVIRVIDTRNALVSLDQLGMSESLYEAFHHEVRKPHGIILVTGPTGSGKSTTLYAVLNEINSKSVNICTVEDPVEFQVPEVNQFQVNEKIGLSFAGVLRSLLRQDPDVIMLGEVRDAETARIAVQAALTGHLVLSTLHTNDSPSAITRLHNLGVESYLISASLVAILAQRLIRSICPHCKRAVEPAPSLLRTAERLGVKLEQVFQGRGCSECHQLGMKGRIGIYELLVPDDELRDAIASGASLGTIRSKAKSMGMKSILEAGFEKVRQGVTTPAEVLRVTAG
ncbi:MAG: Flp pilus assembly complex ATPase component TadA [Phycisphaerae bacterium]|nr:Flp pilus assembly complex ATPase component TadA [Phycisphaerae bacterium]